MQKFFERYPFSDEVIAAGVSGGADSLALVLRLTEAGREVVALTVDHGLRPESAAEAAYVATVMKKFGIEHHILTWTEKKPSAAIEAAAREARYRLLCGWCREHGRTIDQLLQAGWDVGVAWQDGRLFRGPCHIRMNLALPLSRVQEAMERLSKYVFRP